VEVLVGFRDRVLICNAVSCELAAWSCPSSTEADARITQIRLSPHTELVAILNSIDGTVYVLSSDLKTCLSRVLMAGDYAWDAESASGCLVHWCGPVMLACCDPARMTITVVAPCCDTLVESYPMFGRIGKSMDGENPRTEIFLQGEDGSVWVAPEVDGLRIITSDEVSVLTQVTQAQVDVWSVGSTAPGAVLSDARALLENQDPGCETMVRQLDESKKLESAVTCCIRAALMDHDSLRQKALLRAANYGKLFPAQPPPRAGELMRKTVQHLRVLNELRSPSVGMFITAGEAETLGK